MIRKIIKINEEKCNGCGLCVEACHEGAIGMVNGKAKLMRDDYCDGLGDCLPVCPTDAISFEEREAAEYDEAAVRANMEAAKKSEPLPCGCPGSLSQLLQEKPKTNANASTQEPKAASRLESELMQWPVQIKLVPPNAPYFNDADVLIAADCVAYAYANFHQDYMRGKVTLIGCPKLDEGDYTEKLTAIMRDNNVRSVTVARMQVPCCGGIERAAEQAVLNSGKNIPVKVVTFTTDGSILL